MHPFLSDIMSISPTSLRPSSVTLPVKVYVPYVLTLMHTDSSATANDDATGTLVEVMGGWAAQVRWQRAGGHGFPVNVPLTPEAIISKWSVVTNFSVYCEPHLPDAL
jgi:hypothetical protein